MLRVNLLKPKIELFNASKSRREGKEWVVDLGIVHFEIGSKRRNFYKVTWGCMYKGGVIEKAPSGGLHPNRGGVEAEKGRYQGYS